MTAPRSPSAVASTLGVVIAALAYGTIVWRPLAAARAEAASQLMQATADAARAPASGDPARVIAAGAARARLTIRSIGPHGEGTRVVIADAPFDRALDWLARLDSDAGLRVAAISVTRRPQPGRVSMDVTLERA